MIHASKVCKSFGGRQILQDLDYSIERGEIHAWKGSNGCGKTTLARLLAGLETPDSGTITKSDPEIKIVIAQQDFVLWPTLTARQNLDLVAPQTNWLPLARQLDILELLKTRTGCLSYGQKQLLCITRTLALKPDVLIVDEAITHLDTTKRELLLNLLNQKESLTIVWIDHSCEVPRKLKANLHYF